MTTAADTALVEPLLTVRVMLKHESGEEIPRNVMELTRMGVSPVSNARSRFSTDVRDVTARESDGSIALVLGTNMIFEDVVYEMRDWVNEITKPEYSTPIANQFGIKSVVSGKARSFSREFRTAPVVFIMEVDMNASDPSLLAISEKESDIKEAFGDGSPETIDIQALDVKPPSVAQSVGINPDTLFAVNTNTDFVTEEQMNITRARIADLSEFTNENRSTLSNKSFIILSGTDFLDRRLF